MQWFIMGIQYLIPLPKPYTLNPGNLCMQWFIVGIQYFGFTMATSRLPGCCYGYRLASRSLSLSFPPPAPPRPEKGAAIATTGPLRRASAAEEAAIPPHHRHQHLSQPHRPPQPPLRRPLLRNLLLRSAPAGYSTRPNPPYSRRTAQETPANSATTSACIMASSGQGTRKRYAPVWRP